MIVDQSPGFYFHNAVFFHTPDVQIPKISAICVELLEYD